MCVGFAISSLKPAMTLLRETAFTVSSSHLRRRCQRCGHLPCRNIFSRRKPLGLTATVFSFIWLSASAVSVRNVRTCTNFPNKLKLASANATDALDSALCSIVLEGHLAAATQPQTISSSNCVNSAVSNHVASLATCQRSSLNCKLD